jgi:hypothetical protein
MAPASSAAWSGVMADAGSLKYVRDAPSAP